MSDLSEKLLEQAINSILHGSESVITESDSSGVLQYRHIKINDLRLDLVTKLADRLASSPEFKKLILDSFTSEIIKKLQESALAKVSFGDLPWDVKRKFEEQAKTMRLEVKKYKLVAETVEDKT